MRSLMMSLLVVASLFGLAGCGSSASDSGASQVRMLTPEELAEVQSGQSAVDQEERTHFAELAKGVKPAR